MLKPQTIFYKTATTLKSPARHGFSGFSIATVLFFSFRHFITVFGQRIKLVSTGFFLASVMTMTVSFYSPPIFAGSYSTCIACNRFGQPHCRARFSTQDEAGIWGYSETQRLCPGISDPGYYGIAAASAEVSGLCTTNYSIILEDPTPAPTPSHVNGYEVIWGWALGPAGLNDLGAGKGRICYVDIPVYNQPSPKQPKECTDTAGNPIVIADGNKFQTEMDYRSQNPFGLNFIRYYNSGISIYLDPNNDLGKKWSHNFADRIAISGSHANAYRSNGQVYSFYPSGTATWLSDADISETLVELVDAGNNRTGWQYTAANDNVEVYNLSGQLINITNRQGQAKVLSYDIAVVDGGDDDNSTLDRVTGFNSEVMSFTYDSSNRINSMTDPQGNIYLYTYSASNLIKVTYPGNTPNDTSDNQTRTYHYENTTFPHHLTGITDEIGVRYATWQYDSQGRAISSEHTGGTDIGTLVYNADDSVTVTNALGKETTYHFSFIHGVKKVTQVEGHATASCAAANKNYTYDANGYLQSKTDWQGKTTTYIHNARGLETSRTEAAGTPEARTITIDWHATFRLPIKITEPGKVTDYSYDAQGRLTSQTSHTP